MTANPRAFAETLFTVNDIPVESEVLDVYMQSRVQKPLEQVTPEERMALTDDLTDLYVLSTGDMASTMEKDPEVSAQLTLSRLGILARAVATSMAGDIEVTEEEIQTAYEEQITMAPTVQYNARHILVESQGQAVEIIEALDDDADFVELAIERSTGPSAPNGGDLGWFTSDQMVAPFSEAVAKLKDGQYTSEPVQTQFGWHVISRC
jgi:peptidyl-prolyl cis-trans isomerase C